MISITPAIKSLKIRNYGMVRKADFRFTKGINIIYGVCGSGKTTVVNAIRHLVNGEKLIYRQNKDKKSSEKALIELKLLSDKMSQDVTKVKNFDHGSGGGGLHVFGRGIERLDFGRSLEETKKDLSCSDRTLLELIEAVGQSCKGQALLLDDFFCMFDIEHKEKALEILKKSKLQVITTEKREEELVKGANVLRLKIVKRDGGVFSNAF